VDVRPARLDGAGRVGTLVVVEEARPPSADCLMKGLISGAMTGPMPDPMTDITKAGA